MPTTRTSELRPLQVHDATIEYSDSGGDGEPLLLVHAGVFADWFTPLVAEPALAGHRVISMVRAGYTSSPPPGRPLTIGDHAAHIAALLEALDLPGAHVLAHSSGTVIALQLALDRPDLVRTLVLSEPPLIDPLVAPEDLDLVHGMLGPVIGAAVAAIAAGDPPAAFDAFLRAVCGAGYRDVLRTSLGPEGLQRAARGCRYFFTDEVSAMGAWSFDQTIAARVRQPVLLVQGGASPPVVHGLIAHVAAMLPHAETATVEGHDHLLPLTAPAVLADLTASLTRRHPLVRSESMGSI